MGTKPGPQCFTYVKDSHGLIFYTLGPETQPSDALLWVTMVYCPSESSATTRHQLTTGQLSQFRLTSDPSVVVDMRVVRRPGDLMSFPRLTPDALKIGVEVDLSDALVVGAAESLSIPAAYHVENEGGQIIAIVTHYYHHLGAATEGDKVRARGLLIDGHQLLLLDPNRHYVSTSF